MCCCLRSGGCQLGIFLPYTPVHSATRLIAHFEWGLEWWPTSPATYNNGVGCKCGLASLAKANRVGTYYGIDPEELDGVWRSVYIYIRCTTLYNSICHGLRMRFLTCACDSLQQWLMKRCGGGETRNECGIGEVGQ